MKRYSQDDIFPGDIATVFYGLRESLLDLSKAVCGAGCAASDFDLAASGCDDEELKTSFLAYSKEIEAIRKRLNEISDSFSEPKVDELLPLARADRLKRAIVR